VYDPHVMLSIPGLGVTSLTPVVDVVVVAVVVDVVVVLFSWVDVVNVLDVVDVAVVVVVVEFSDAKTCNALEAGTVPTSCDSLPTKRLPVKHWQSMRVPRGIFSSQPYSPLA